MSDATGRLSRSVDDEARRIVFGATADASIDADLAIMTEIDRAHLVMLAERGFVEGASAACVIDAISRLRADDFAPLRGRSAPRGLYLLYESYLIEQLGMSAAGALHSGRSRNDLGAALFRIRARRGYAHLIDALATLLHVVLERSERYATMTMPLYTHFQPALPSTYGHYLVAIGAALARDLDALVAAGAELDASPLGAGAGGGTSLPIDCARTMELLGFTRVIPSSIDAVAARDLALRLLAAASILGVTLGRCATDLLLWTSAEYGLLTLSDHLVGSSSMMPQKRNPFLLEHVQSRNLAALSGFMQAASSMHAAPYTNSIAVGTEGTSPLGHGLQSVTDSCDLLRLVLADARPDEARMLERAESGYTCATELANRLTVAGVPFRQAHHVVGDLVSRAIADGGATLAETAARHGLPKPGIDVTAIDAAAVAQATRHGGGPNRETVAAARSAIGAQVQSALAIAAQRRSGWAQAAERLDRAVAELHQRHGGATARTGS